MNLAAIHVSCVVEGHGDRLALPVLIRRIAQERNVLTAVSPPIRVSRSSLVKEDGLKRAVELAARRVAEPGGILVLLDSDDDCPAQVGPRLLAWAREARADKRIAVVLAKVEYEAWFLASAESIAGHRDLQDELPAPADPEGISDAKGWLSRHMSGSRVYSETLDQPALSAVFDIATARRSDSFDKFCREIDRLLAVPAN